MKRTIKALWEAISRAGTPPMFARAEVGTVWRHKKTGHFYVIVGRCQLERDWQLAIQYVRLNNPEAVQSDGPIARDFNEFMDGRFIPVKIVAKVRPEPRYLDGSSQPKAAITGTPPPPNPSAAR